MLRPMTPVPMNAIESDADIEKIVGRVDKTRGEAKASAQPVRTKSRRRAKFGVVRNVSPLPSSYFLP